MYSLRITVEMEELLQDIFKEAGPKLLTLKKSCQDALEVLCLQESTKRRTSHELRQSCLLPLQMALETKRTRLINFGINGFHKIIRDDRFHRGIEPEDDSLWLPSQLLCATTSVMYQLPETQVQIFRMYLSLALSPRRTLNGRLCVWICGRCAEAAGCTPPVAAAAKAAAAQTIRAYCTQLDEEYQELLSESSPLGKSRVAAVGCYSEIIPVIQYLCGRLSETQIPQKQNLQGLFFLDCLLTLISSLSDSVSGNSHFTTFLWQKFCPSLISFLGTPRVDKNFKTREHDGNAVDDSGRGSGALVSAPNFNCKQAKAIYSIANQLVRLVGPTPNLRPVLEALYHRMLLYPPVINREEPLRSVRELLQNPKRLMRLVLKKSGEVQECHSDDMAIVRLIMDGIEECGQSCEPSVLIAAVECVVGLLDAIQNLCAEPNEFITEDQARVMMKRWPTLQDADYSGPLTYQTLARLPSPYRDVVAVLQSTEEKEGDSSDTSGPENASSASDAEADSDVDNVFLPSRANQPSSTRRVDSNTPTRENGLAKAFDFGRNNESECNVDLERHNARQFVKTLQNNLIPKLVNLRTCIEVDEAMQEYASKCCQHNASQPPATACIMNADGVYLATYAALLLNLQLKRTNYYNEPNRSLVPTSEEQFVTGVQTSGGAVWAAGAWLREVYQRVLQKDLLHALSTAHEQTNKDDCALVHLLSDLGGLDQNPIMSDWQKLKEVSMIYNNVIETPQQLASFRWARRILTCIWDSMVEILSIPLMGYRSKKQKIHGIISKKLKTFGKRKRAAWEALTIQCLEGLHKAARVSNTLHLQNRCSHILGLLAKSAVSQPPNGKILSTHALSLDILITGGLELGSKAPECWEHIFTACQYVSSLEHSLFGQQGNNATTIVTMQMGRNKPISMLQADGKLGLEAKDDETCVDVFNFLQPAFGNTSSNEMSVSQIVESCRQEGGNIISGSSAARVCCVLSASADALFSRLASTATLPAARAALRRLERYQQRALFSEWEQDVANNNVRWWRRNSTRLNNVGEACRSICRMGDLALRCLKSTRPLAHRMAIWAIVGPHFMQVACHKDIQISSLAIQCLHDCITTLLNQQVELPHFHFNEALLKPFENLLCLELCDDDIQEQIIACICELVETNRMEIRSGWRPLFNTLRAANNANQYSALLEIFRVFLNTDNTLVFANAALDCILCLLSHIKGLNAEETTTTEVKPKKQARNPKSLLALRFSKNSKFIPFNEEKTENVKVDMCKEALQHLENCAEILAMMYNMPKCPVFNTGNRVKGDLPLSLVDPIILSYSLDVTKFISNDYNEGDMISYRKLSTSLPVSNTTNNCLLKLDKPSNIIKVWYILIEGLISATVVCSKKNQPAAMETLFKILKNTYEVPGSHFGLHCINHLLLPAVQNWLRQTSHNNPTWDNVLANFKQCCGMTTDLFVFYLHQLQGINFERFDKETKKEITPFESPEVTLALKQIMLILVECIAQPQEPVARLGASCIRHIILTSGQLLTNHQWAVICTSLHRACNVCLTPLKQLTYAFKENSLSFYGDLAIVKVAARRDCTVNDNVRLHAMAQQVFLNEAKQEKHSKLTPKNSAQNLMLIDDRSYIFLIYVKDPKSVQNPEFHTVRIPHRGLVVGLLAHQILVQIIATIFIQASSDVFRGINSIFLESLKTGSNDCNQKFYLNKNNTEILVKALDLSYLRAMQFDSRPGLKFLVQKVSNLDYAANLYKQTTSSWLVKVIALTETFFKGAQKFKLISTDISIILQEYTTSKNLTLEYDTFVSKIFDLKNTWEWLCNSYVKQIINVSDFDEPKDGKRNSCSSIDTDSSSNVNEYYTNENADVINVVNISQYEYQKSEEHTAEDKTKSVTSDHQPFTFADFKKQSQSSATGENNQENSIETDPSDKISVSEEKLDESPEKVNKTKIDTIQNSYKGVYNGTTKDFNSPGIKNDEIITNETDENKTAMSKTIKTAISETTKTAMSETTDIEAAAKTVNIEIADKSSASVNIGSINGEPVIPPQPVPPEIEQQRTLSISKDKEVQRNCFQNILLAYLELVLTFPPDRFTLINPVLKPGFIQLAHSVTDPLLIERISIFLEKEK